MSNPVISVENLSKSYRLGQIGTGTFSRDLEVWWAKLRGKPNPLLKIGEKDHGNREGETLWALNDVSFSVEQGEVLGIIGRNGAGKSTLLKILSRVTAPTSGRVKVKGRIASLLEVGTGFHPELTGRENIYLNGAIMGMNREEVSRKFDEIVAFSEVEKFIDTPVKRYSSGMYVRLAFAVAAHLDPEILLVDEVLAVGDAEFQKKCLGKMGDVAKEGRTVLFVSHNLAGVQQLCSTGLLIDQGKKNYWGTSSDCIDQYMMKQRNDHSGNILENITWSDPIVNVDFISVNGTEKDELSLPLEEKSIRIEITGTLAESANIEVEAKITDINGIPLAFYSPGHDRGFVNRFPPGRFRLERKFNLPRVSKGDYLLSLYLTYPNVKGWVEVPNAILISTVGAHSNTGLIYEYTKGTGWVILSDVNDRGDTKVEN